jgi:hypothetical protein
LFLQLWIAYAKHLTQDKINTIIIILVIIIIINKPKKFYNLYKDFTIEIQCMWDVKTKVIPVIIGAAGTIS